LAACFQAYLDSFGAVCRGHVAIDGKTLRGAHERAAGASPLQMVSAFASETRLTLGQIAVDAQINKIPTVRALLSLLSLEGCTVTLDALHAQRETAQALRDQGPITSWRSKTIREACAGMSALCWTTPACSSRTEYRP
jgi:Transposase DDE domain